MLLGWLTAAGARQPPAGEVVSDIASVAAREALRGKTVAKALEGSAAAPVLVCLGGTVHGLVNTYRCEGGLPLFHGLCELEALKDGVDFTALGQDAGLGDGEVVLVTQELFATFLCRMWARGRLYDAMRPLLSEAGGCPFNQGQAPLRLGTDQEVADHYLELLLGRGQKEACPQAEKYLQGVARDLSLGQLPYLSSVLVGRAGATADSSVLSILTKPGTGRSELPKDFQEDLALAVAAKALELVQALGLDL